MTSALTITNYGLDYMTSAGAVAGLRGVSLGIPPGGGVGLVGESGSGKSSLAWALMRHLPANAREISGSLMLGDIDLQSLTPRQLTAVRGRRIGMVFQDPSAALNPTLTIGRQITEALMRHRDLKASGARDLAIDLLGHVELRDPAAIMRRYPHEISGGEKQRVIIATAFGCRPDVILFDEPTTALDVITGARILELFARLREETGVAALYISHDLAMMTRVADRVAVIRHGRVVEQAKVSEIFRKPQHDYTK